MDDSFYAQKQKSDVFFQMYSEHSYDFLWVLDNSGSMAPRRNFVRDNMAGFMNTISTRKAVDFQMAVATTDFFTDQGNLISSPSGLSVVTSSSADPAVDMASIINNVQDSATSFWEQGLESAYQAMAQHGKLFSRPGVPLIIIFISDDNDWSCESHCWGVEPEHNPDWIPFSESRYIKYFQTVKNPDNSEVMIFPIVGTDPSRCSIASQGYRYMDLANAMGTPSMNSSICDADLQTSYNNVAETLADRGIRFHLNSPSDGKNVNVYVNHVLIPYDPTNYIYDPATNDIVFTGAVPKKGDIIEVTYSQKTT